MATKLKEVGTEPPAEVWKAIASHPDYSVSSLGRVKRSAADRYGRGAGRLLKPVLSNNGYCIVTLHRDARQATYLLHRLVCEAFHGPQPENCHACHCDGNRLNNHSSNLRWDTVSANNMDKHFHGTIRTGRAHHAVTNPECMPRGEAHGNAKLSDAAILSIRSDSRRQSEIARDYGVSQSLISMVKTRKIWAHVGEFS